MIQLGIFAKTWSLTDVRTIFQHIKGHDLSQVQFNMTCCGLTEQPKEVPDSTLQEIIHAAKTFDLGIAGLSSTFNMIHPDSEVIQAGLASLQELASICRELNCPLLTVCSGTRNPIDKWKWHPDNGNADSWRQFLQTLESAIAIVEKYDLQLGIEPEIANVVCNVRQAHKLLKEMRSDRLRIILDPANLFEKANGKEEITVLILEAIELLQNDIAMVHAKDRSIAGEIKAPGKGDIDFRFFSECLNRINFQGPMIMHGLAENEVAESVQYLKDVLN